MAVESVQVWSEDQVPLIRYRGVYDWTALYRFTRHWIEDQHFRYYEKRYKHKGDEVEVEMRGDREVDAMFKYHIEVNFHLWKLDDIEVVEGSKKVKKNTGRLHIEIKGMVECDHASRFTGNKLHETLGKWWFKIMEKEIETKHVDGFTYLLYGLHEKQKKLLNMTSDSNAF